MATKKMICPLMKVECIADGAVVDGELHACMWWVEIHGKDPQNGDTITKTGNCAITWQPILMIENTKVSMGTTAATESFRNEMVNGNAMVGQALGRAMQLAQSGGPPLKTIEQTQTPPLSGVFHSRQH